MEKTQKTGFLNANKMPLKAHENILVFYKKLPTYHAQKSKINVAGLGRKRVQGQSRAKQYGEYHESIYQETGQRFPSDVIEFSNWNGALFGNTTRCIKHPTSKPAPLLEYLIKTYTNEGETVLDNCMGSGSCGVACINTNRNFIGIELNDDFFEVAKTFLFSKGESNV